jgi:hypothetical protein
MSKKKKESQGKKWKWVGRDEEHPVVLPDLLGE